MSYFKLSLAEIALQIFLFTALAVEIITHNYNLFFGFTILIVVIIVMPVYALDLIKNTIISFIIMIFLSVMRIPSIYIDLAATQFLYTFGCMGFFIFFHDSPRFNAFYNQKIKLYSQLLKKINMIILSLNQRLPG